jgi:hypothetical protein
MATISAGIRVNEFDFSEYAVQLGKTRLLVVGGASKGAMNVPTEVQTDGELLDKFGGPLLDDYGIQAGRQFLKEGDQLLYLRVGDGTEKASTAAIPGTSGGTPAVAATGSISFTGSNNPVDAETIDIYETVPWANLENDAVGAAGNVAITVPVGGARISVDGMAGGDIATPATGWVKLIGGALPLDGDQITISDGVTSRIFEFDDNAAITGDVTVDITGVTDPNVALALLVAAINGDAFNVSATNYSLTKKHTFEFDDDASIVGGNVGVLIGSDAAATLVNLILAINTEGIGISVEDGTVTVPQADLTHDTGGIDGNAPLVTDGVNIGVTGLSGGAEAVPGALTTVMGIEAATPGTWGDDVEVEFSATAIIGAPAGNFDISVYAPVDKSGVKQVVERFFNVSLDPTSERFIEVMVNEGIRGEVDKSEYIVADALTTGEPTVGLYALGATVPEQGSNGIAGLDWEDYVGTISGTGATGLQAARNPERVEFNVLAVPGITDVRVVNAMIEVSEYRADCVCIVDPPFGLTRDEVVDWHNGDLGSYPNSPTAPVDTSYACLAWAWLQVEDDYNKQDVWLPPSGFIAARFAFTDRNAAPWFPAAGHNRGLIDAKAVEYSPTLEDRDLLCPIVGGQNRVNPIVDFAQDGPTFYGNKTLYRSLTSQLVDLHVRRLLLYAEKLCATSVKYLVFEPNDPNTWKKFEQMCNKHLKDIASARGLEAFQVTCNESTNPVALRRQKRMKGKLSLIPQGAAEAIDLDFGIFAAGASFDEAAA